MRSATLTFAFILFSLGAFSQKLIKVTKSEFPNGQKEVVETYRDEEKPENLAKRETYSPNGKKVREESFLDGELSGLQKEWTESGTKTFEGNYVAGKKEGTHKRWDPGSEKLVSELNYSKGIPEGKHSYYFADGEIKAEFNYVGGKPNGLQKEMHTPDQVRFELNYANGIPHGQQREFYADGTDMFNLHFVAGKLDGIQKFYARPGANPEIQTWKQGKFENMMSKWPGGQRKEVTVFEFEIFNPDTLPLRGERFPVRKITYYETGSINKIQDMGEDSKTKIFYMNGKVQAEGGGSEKKPDGVWTWYAKDGKITKKGTYKDGMETGEWAEYNADGKEQMKWESDGKGNRENRTVFFYHSNGTLESSGQIDEEGRKSGEWKYFFEDGNERREEKYTYNCKQKGGRPYLDDFTEWLPDKRVHSAGSERDYATYEYDDDNKVTTEYRWYSPFRSPCTKGIIEYYKDGKILRNDKILDESSGKLVPVDSAVLMEKLIMDYAGQARQKDRFNRQGIRDGKQEGWYASGVRKYVFDYKDGSLNGEAKEWYPNSSIRIDVMFDRDSATIPASGKYATSEGKEYEFERAKHKELKKKMLEIMEGSHLADFLSSSGR